ncbi:MAG: penicillin-binding protein 2 [Actinomycetota bacterium]
MSSNGRRRPSRTRTVASARPAVCPHRLRTLVAVFILVMGGFLYRLADLQLTPDPALAEPISRTLRTEELLARRGPLVDRLGRPLAYSLPAPTIVADPRLVPVEQIPWVVGQLTPLLDTDPEVLVQRLSSDAHFVYLDRQVDPEIGEAVMALGLPGVWSYDEPRREHPNGDCTGLSLLGRVDTDHRGISGLEKIYDELLTGTPGARAVEVSADRRSTIVGGQQVIEPAIPGEELGLTLDRDIQFKAQEILEDALAANDADLGMIIVTIPHSGEVIAAVSATRDEETDTVDCTSNNLPFTHIFEPGSTMKIVPVAAVLESGAVQPHTAMDVEVERYYPLDDGGQLRVHDDGRYEDRVYTPTDILVRSSNVGTTILAEVAGPTAVYDLMRDFGFGSTSGVDFPGESAGILEPFTSSVALPTASYGQGVAVTAAQIIEAYNTIANGGVEVPLVLTADAPSAAERVISAETSAMVLDMLEGVVVDENGTGKPAAVPGYTVAGKTSTAWQPCNGGPTYTCPTDDPDGRTRHYTPGFAGIVSNDQGPQFSVFVMIDNPKGDNYYGGSVAGPVFADIAAYTARQLQIPQTASGVTTTAVRAEVAAAPTTTLAAESQDG